MPASDVLIGLATGKSRRGVERLIAQHGWADWFATTQSADDAPSKPDPTMLQQAMAEAGCEPGATVMVGDTTFDIAMGVAAGANGGRGGLGLPPAGGALRSRGGHGGPERRPRWRRSFSTGRRRTADAGRLALRARERLSRGDER